MGGDTPPTPSLFVPNTLFYNINDFSPPPPPRLVLQSYTFRAKLDVNLQFVTHPKPGFSTQISTTKNPHRGRGIPPRWCPIFNHSKRAAPPPPPLPRVRQKFIAQTYSTFRAKMRNSGKTFCAPPNENGPVRLWCQPHASVHISRHEHFPQYLVPETPLSLQI